MTFLAHMLADHMGLPSSKRVVGVVGAFVLFGVFALIAVAAVVLAFKHKTSIVLDPVLTGVVSGVVVGALGLTTIEKRPRDKADAAIAVQRASAQVPAIPEEPNA